MATTIAVVSVDIATSVHPNVRSRTGAGGLTATMVAVSRPGAAATSSWRQPAVGGERTERCGTDGADRERRTLRRSRRPSIAPAPDAEDDDAYGECGCDEEQREGDGDRPGGTGRRAGRHHHRQGSAGERESGSQSCGDPDVEPSSARSPSSRLARTPRRPSTIDAGSCARKPETTATVSALSAGTRSTSASTRMMT